MSEAGEQNRCDLIVCEEWRRAVKEFELRPGNITEKVVARILIRIRKDNLVEPVVTAAYRKG